MAARLVGVVLREVTDGLDDARELDMPLPHACDSEPTRQIAYIGHC